MDTEDREGAAPKSTDAAQAKAEDVVTSGHTCGVCGRSFPLLSSLSQHMRRHTREKPYKCPYCEHRTAQKGTLKAHVRSHKLGLLSQNPSGKEDVVEEEEEGEEVDGEHDDVEMPDGSPEVKVHNMNGKVKKKETAKKAKAADKKSRSGDGDADAGPFSCSLCGQDFPQLLLLKAHMKRHRGAQDHACRVCGRRFRQAWFLQSHMRIHRMTGQLTGERANEPPATVNGVPQDPASLVSEGCLYELCAGCGNFFFDRSSLQIHKRLHGVKAGQAQTQDPPRPENLEVVDQKRRFMESLSLKCAGSVEKAVERKLGGRIPQLDPVCSYQAWQLATRGRLAEASEKCLGWEERLADAEVAFDRQKGEYVPVKQEKKRKQSEPFGSGVKKKKSEAANRGGDTRVLGLHKDRLVLNGLGHAFYEALQSKTAKDLGFSGPKRAGKKQGQDENKLFFCEHCDFHTGDASLLRSHLQSQHGGFAASSGKHATVLDNCRQNAPKASRYTDYLRSRSELLSQASWGSYVPAGAGVKTEKCSDGETVDPGAVLDLTAGEEPAAAVKTDGLLRHCCPFCSHTTSYPEVLWIHQRVAHRVDSNSSLAPKWAPGANAFKGSKCGSIARWRRTGAPPFLEGKDCPVLPAPRTQRTLAPGAVAHGATSSKNSKTVIHKPRPGAQQREVRPWEGLQSGGTVAPGPQKRAGEQAQATETCSKAAQAPCSSSKGPPAAQAAGSPKERRAAGGTHLLPQEGLGFILARNQARNQARTSPSGPSAPSADRPQHRRPCESTAGPKAPDLWNMWGLHGGDAYADRLLFAQGKSDLGGDSPDVLTLLKSYDPRDLAALYQHWRFVDPRLNPQALLQLNGHFGSEVNPSPEASKQVNSRSASSSGSYQKGT